jgi:hypothetical protein
MTTALRVTCGNCGDVEVPLDHGRLVLGLSPRAAAASLQFDCPRCRSVGTESVDERAVGLLLKAGISVVAPSPHQHRVGETQTPN